MKQLSCLFIVLFVSCNISLAANSALPKHVPVPGGVAVIQLKPSGNKQPKAQLEGKPLLVARTNNHWFAIAGISLETKPGIHHVRVTEADGSISEYPVRVKSRDYPAQYLKVKNKRHVEPSKKDLERIIREKNEILDILSTFSSFAAGHYRFRKPVKGRLSSRFGLKRFFNGKPRRPHSGLDIAAKRGTNIHVPLQGRVIGTGNYFFSGNLVFIDHGQGLISSYSHLNKILVKPGQLLKTGDLIGKVGSTGRVTGPHLHWSIYLNQTRVDPEYFL